MLTRPPDTPEFTLTEISGAVSRITGLPMEHAEVARYSGNLLGLMNSNPALRMAGPNSPAIADYIRQYIPAELAEKADPAKRAELDNRESSKATITAAAAATTAWLARMQGGRDWAANGYGGGDGKTNAAGAAAGSRTTNYQDISYNSPQSLYAISSINYQSTPFASTGMNWNTFQYMRNYIQNHDPSITPQNVLDAAKDVKRFGLSNNDKGAMRDQAIIRHYDDKPEATVKALEKFSKPNPEDQAKLDKLNIDLMKAKTPEARAAAKQAIKAFHSERRKTTGVQGRIDSTPTKKAKDAIGHQGDRIEQNLNNQSLERLRKKGYRADATPDPVENDHKGPSHADLTPSKILKRGDAADAQYEEKFNKLALLQSPTDSSPKSTPQQHAEAPAGANQRAQDNKSKDEKPSTSAPESKPEKSSNKEPAKPIVIADKPKKPSGPSVA